MRGRRALSDDHAYPQTDQFVCKRAETVGLSFRKSILDGNILPNNVSQVAQAPLEGVSAGYHRGARVDAQKSNRDFIGCLLRARSERPRCRGAAECGQQLPPSDDDCHTPLPCEVRKGRYHATSVQSWRSRRAECWLLRPSLRLPLHYPPPALGERRHCCLARWLIAVDGRAIFVVAVGQRPEPRHPHGR